MQLIPAIDLRRGEVVRLVQGDDNRRKSYRLDARQVLRRFASAGADLVHVVDLDAAFGEAPQRRLIAELAAGETRIELGGGLRDLEAVRWALAAGCERVILGSIVVRDFAAFASIVEAFPGRVVPALEMSAGRLRLAGWREETQRTVEEIGRRLAGLECPAVLVTDVERDGSLGGPNLELPRRISAITGLPALMSGGVRSLDDLRAAAKVPEIAGAIVGKALYEKLFSVEEALAVCAGGQA